MNEATPPEPIRQNLDGINAIFVHSAVDEAGLDPYEFRILMHLSRRANRKQMAWPSLRSMSDTTGISERKIREALGGLQARRMLTITQAPGHGNRHQYELTDPTEWILKPAPGAASEFQTGTTCRFEPAPHAGSYTREGNPSEGYPDPPTPTGAGGDFEAKISKKSGKSPKPSKAKSRDHESAHHYPEAWQQDVAFTNALADYFRQRREKRQPATPTAAELLRKKLLAAGIETATIALQTSATNGWTGVFPEKTTHPTKEKPGADEPNLALW